MSSNYLGGGTYGEVYRVGDIAVKYFDCDMSLIQEYAAGTYLKNCPYVVRVYNMNIRELSMNMKLYNSSLKDWMWETYRTEEQRNIVVREILKGLIWFNDLSLVHGDLKPGNILCNWDYRGNITRLVIADLGFVAPEGYSKARRTAPAYRELKVEKDFRHDIYSLGIILIELFGQQKVRKQLSSERLITIAKKRVKNKPILETIISCLSEDRAKRRTARYIMLNLFQECPDFKIYKKPGAYVRKITEDQELTLKETFINVGMKQMEIHRSKTAFQGCRHFISNKVINVKLHNLYAIAAMVIFSAVFGRSGFTTKAAATYFKVSRNQIIKAVEELLEDDTFILYLYYDMEA